MIKDSVKLYYRCIKVEEGGSTVYELNIRFPPYVIGIHHLGTHPPTKRLLRKRPLDYFKIIPRNEISVFISLDSGDERGILIENPNLNTLKDLLTKCAIGTNWRSVIEEFLKTLYV